MTKTLTHAEALQIVSILGQSVVRHNGPASPKAEALRRLYRYIASVQPSAAPASATISAVEAH